MYNITDIKCKCIVNVLVNDGQWYRTALPSHLKITFQTFWSRTCVLLLTRKWHPFIWTTATLLCPVPPYWANTFVCTFSTKFVWISLQLKNTPHHLSYCITNNVLKKRQTKTRFKFYKSILVRLSYCSRLIKYADVVTEEESITQQDNKAHEHQLHCQTLKK